MCYIFFQTKRFKRRLVAAEEKLDFGKIDDYGLGSCRYKRCMRFRMKFWHRYVLIRNCLRTSCQTLTSEAGSRDRRLSKEKEDIAHNKRLKEE